MAAWRVLGTSLVLVALFTCPALGAEVKAPSLWQALSRMGDSTIPAAWSGIWSVTDTTRDCTTREVKNVSASEDTLCAGEPISGDTSGEIEFVCTGTATDTEVDVTCTGGFAIGECAATFTQHIQATRTGETAVSTMTFTIVYTPTGCAFGPDTCEEVTSVMTRTGPQPESCATPVRRTTWGSVKSLYR